MIWYDNTQGGRRDPWSTLVKIRDCLSTAASSSTSPPLLQYKNLIWIISDKRLHKMAAAVVKIKVFSASSYSSFTTFSCRLLSLHLEIYIMSDCKWFLIGEKMFFLLQENTKFKNMAGQNSVIKCLPLVDQTCHLSNSLLHMCLTLKEATRSGGYMSRTPC